MVLIILVVVIIVIIALSAFATLLAPSSSSPWKPTATYPLQIEGTFGVFGQQCVNSTVYVYCIGGEDASGGPRNDVYTSSAISLSSGNITGWTLEPTLPPPLNAYGQSCVAYTGYVYCVGGTYDDVGDDVAFSYYAPLLSNGAVGSWNPTTPYPYPADSQYCVASSGYIYCVGGVIETEGTNATSTPSNSVWYAPLSSSGIGSWSQSASYPADISLSSCAAANGFIYCVGGVNSNGNAQSADYYASLSSSGVGTWTLTTPYQIAASGQACAISSGLIYCVGGVGSTSYLNSVYYAAVSSGGIGAWTKAGNYPQSVVTDCVISQGYMYCIGGLGSSALYGRPYYISLESLVSVTTTTSG